MTTITEIAEAVREACSIYLLKEHGMYTAGEHLEQMDLAPILAQFGDVVVVPKEPTGAILEAGYSAGDIRSSWKAMLAAAQEQRHK